MSSPNDSKRRNDKVGAGISRRRFIGGAAGSGIALALSGLVSGCAADPTATAAAALDPTTAPTTVPVSAVEPAATVETVQANDRTFEVFETDVLVIGGGLAGMFTAIKAVEGGARVILADKGPFGHSGTSGINWGHDLETNEWAEDDGSGTIGAMVFINEGVIDQDYVTEVCKAVHEAKPTARNAQVGGIVERNTEGHPNGGNAAAAMTVDEGCFPRMFAQYVARTNAIVMDRVMVVDILTSDAGEAAGAVAIDLVTGEPIVYRAKSVVIATGNYAWDFGWAGNGPVSIAGLENTGDGHSILINHGAEMMYMEQLPASCYQQYPKGIAYGMGSLGYGLGNYKSARNKNGERFNQIMDEVGAMTGLNNRLVMREIYDGRGSEDGGVFLDVTELETMNRYHRRVPENEKRGLNYDMPDLIEVKMQYWDSAGRPTLSKTSETFIPGLFYAGTADMAYSGCCFFGATGSGWLAGKNAAERAKNVERPNVSWSAVSDILNKAYDALERQPENSKRALTVFHTIQQAMFNGVGFLRDDAGMKACIAELERIKAEDIPAMAVPTKSRHFNYEWRQALEVPNMWNCVMGTVQSALARTETRCSHIRTDYPNIDNENWLKNVYVKLQDGQWVVDIRPIIDTVIPAETVKTMVLNVGF